MATATGSSTTNTSVNGPKYTLMVTGGQDPLRPGIGAFFLRTTSKAISQTTFAADITFGSLNSQLLPSLTSVVKNIIVPALTAQENWGSLKENRNPNVGDFLDTLRDFVNDMDVAMLNLRDSMKLHPCTVNLDAYKKPSEYPNAAHNPEIVNGLEGKL